MVSGLRKRCPSRGRGLEQIGNNKVKRFAVVPVNRAFPALSSPDDRAEIASGNTEGAGPPASPRGNRIAVVAAAAFREMGTRKISRLRVARDRRGAEIGRARAARTSGPD